ncbi:MAG: hypothetical protein CM1200mP36_10530 [Gammaproteobacteria bacterium]|nr:MAG: hypothetical protein CM1200mP36_10530 [Gammaproteobacteria bacterium]
MLMVKPALAYLDVIQAVRSISNFRSPPTTFRRIRRGEGRRPQRGWLDEARVVRENLMAIRRAGADQIITYHARDAIKGAWL